MWFEVSVEVRPSGRSLWPQTTIRPYKLHEIQSTCGHTPTEIFVLTNILFEDLSHYSEKITGSTGKTLTEIGYERRDGLRQMSDERCLTHRLGLLAKNRHVSIAQPSTGSQSK